MRCQNARKRASLALDNRLSPELQEQLEAHLRSCSSCRGWRQAQSRLQRLIALPPALDLDPGPGLNAAVMARIAAAAPRRSWVAFPALQLPVALLRAAALLLFAFSAAFGLFLGSRLEGGSAANGAAAFSQALNLEAFADLPGDSFGAVYERLLQGDIQ